MGIIKDGKIYGELPSNNVFAVHYPAYPSSLERAVETLGGTEAISKAHSSESNKLELHFRPEDPYSHPVFGKLQPCSKFLLRISKGKVGNAQDAAVTSKVSRSETPSREVENQALEETEGHLSADIVAHITEGFYFNGMADYQHVLAVHADVARRKKRNWAEFEKSGLMDVDQEDLMILLPPLFSLKDLPEKVVLKPSADIISRKKQDAFLRHHWELDIEPSFGLDFKIKEIPKKVNWEKYILQGSEQWEVQKTVSELFDERPIWVRSAISERLLDKGFEVGDNLLKRLLFRAAYSFCYGPFFKFLIKKGYDPRSDPESRLYQKTDFRVPPSFRSYCEPDGEHATRLKQRWDDICAFRVFPYNSSTTLQLCELVDDFIQEEIRKPPTQATCSVTTGWFSFDVVNTLRLRVMVRFLSVYPKPGAESLLRQKSKLFEKSKRLCMFPKNPKVNEAEQTDRDIVEGEDENQNVDEEDGEDGEDDEDEENEVEDINEDLDAYDALNLGGMEGNSSHQQPYHDISRSYLQELFGSFPLNGDGENELHDGNQSDGEYQIYEQCSDGDYSDDGDDDDEY